MRNRLPSLLIVCAAIFVAISANASTPRLFETAQSFTIPTNTYAFAVGDFNGDGNLDIVAIGDSSLAQIYLGNGKGGFVKAGSGHVSAPAECITVGDFNGDGKLDVAIAGVQEVDILLGNGDGTFQTTKRIGQPGVDSIASGDFNNDGKTDLLLNQSMMMLGKGDGTFQPATTFGAYYSAVAPAVGDFNEDHKLDFAVIDNSGDNYTGSVVTYLGNGDGTFQPPTTLALPGHQPGSITSADFNGDGKSDLAVTGCPDIYCNSPSTANILLSNGDGTFQLQSVTAVVGFKPVSILTSDFNRDGKIDVAVVNSSSDITVWTGKGDGAFNPSQSWAVPAGPVYAVVGDFNNDGQPDVEMLNIQNYGTVDVMTLALGSTGGRFQAPYESYVYAADVLATGDFNEDGKLDVIASSGFDNKGTVALGNGNGTFRALPSFGMMPAGDSAGQILVGDFNGDHHLDVVSSSFTKTGQIILSLGKGNGTFKPGAFVHCGAQATFAVAGDFNGDGILDLVMSNSGRNPTVDVCLGNGDGTFQAPAIIALSNSLVPKYAGAIDLNGDGKLDLVVVNSGIPGSFLTLLGNGDGTFQPPSATTALGTYPLQPVFADLNGDGKMDMALQMNNSSNNLYVLLGNGDGSFRAPQTYSMTEGPDYVIGGPVLADFNGDGFLDIAAPYGCCQPAEFGINILFGDGHGSFALGYTIGVVPGEIIGADVNGDGKTDILFGNGYSNMVSALLNIAP